MKLPTYRTISRRLLFIALPLAVGLVLIFPAIVSAHAILLRSDPTSDAKLTTAPQQVRMWFSEDLNRAFTTAVVLDQNNHEVDKRDAHVASGNTREMDVSLQANLPPAVYVVIWRTDSADDGHILRGSFLFYVLQPDGTVPSLSPGANPGANALGSGNLTGLYTGQLDGPTIFNLIMITLVEMGAVFWVGAQLWLNFVLQLSSEAHEEERAINERVQQRFERQLSLPILFVLLLANIGVVVGQALNLTGGAWNFSASLLIGLATSGRFGTFWSMREIVIILAILLGLYMLLKHGRGDPSWSPARIIASILPFANLALGLALFIAITLSSHAAAVNNTASLFVYAILVDWLHLLAAALWVGGMMYLAVTYLPVLRRFSIAEQSRSLITTLPYFSILAVAGVVIMAVTGPLSATFHLNSWNQFLTTAYGRALLVKILLVGGLMLTSAIHVGLLRPRMKKEYQKYAYAVQRSNSREQADEDVEQIQSPKQASSVYSRGDPGGRPGNDHPGNDRPDAEFPEPVYGRGDPGGHPGANGRPGDRATRLIAQQVKLREGRLTKKTNRLTEVLRWEPLLGVGVLICVGLMNVFAGTLSPIATAAQQQQTTGNTSKPFVSTVRTTDNKFTVKLNVNPNRFGPNVFTVSVVDNSTGKPTTNIGLSLYTTMLDMDMGTQTFNLQPDGKGNFTTTGDLTMAGDWQIRIQIRTPDNTLHETKVELLTPF